MEYTSLPQALEALEKLQSTLFAYNHAMGILSQDASTAAPEGSWEARGKTMEVLTKVSYDLTADPQNGILYDYLSAHASELTPIQARELEVLKNSLDDMIDLLNPGGRICVITFHSLEDRIVKTIFKTNENPCTCPSTLPVCVCGKKPKGRVAVKKPIVPGPEELEENKRSKSSKLRVFERI